MTGRGFYGFQALTAALSQIIDRRQSAREAEANRNLQKSLAAMRISAAQQAAEDARLYAEEQAKIEGARDVEAFTALGGTLPGAGVGTLPEIPQVPTYQEKIWRGKPSAAAAELAPIPAAGAGTTSQLTGGGEVAYARQMLPYATQEAGQEFTGQAGIERAFMDGIGAGSDFTREYYSVGEKPTEEEILIITAEAESMAVAAGYRSPQEIAAYTEGLVGQIGQGEPEFERTQREIGQAQVTEFGQADTYIQARMAGMSHADALSRSTVGYGAPEDPASLKEMADDMIAFARRGRGGGTAAATTTGGVNYARIKLESDSGWTNAWADILGLGTPWVSSFDPLSNEPKWDLQLESAGKTAFANMVGPLEAYVQMMLADPNADVPVPPGSEAAVLAMVEWYMSQQQAATETE